MASDMAAAYSHCGAPIATDVASSHKIANPPANGSVGFGLGICIFLVPLVFVWFLLRQGHSAASRVIGFAWLALFLFGVASSERASTQSAVAPSSETQPAKDAASAEPQPKVSSQ